MERKCINMLLFTIAILATILAFLTGGFAMGIIVFLLSDFIVAIAMLIKGGKGICKLFRRKKK